MSDTPHPINTHVRMFDLVRFMRSELLRANLITEEEHAWLCHESPMAQGEGSPSPRRLEDYDGLRKQLARAQAGMDTYRSEVARLESDIIAGENEHTAILAEAHERISWLEKQREVECQQKEAALRESALCLKERDGLRETIRELKHAAEVERTGLAIEEEKLRAEVQRANARAATVQSENNRLREDTCAQAIADLRAQLASKEDELRQQTETLRRGSSEMARLSEQNTELRAELAELHSARRGDAETHAQEQGALMASETALRDKLIDTERELQKLRGFYDQVVAEVGHDRIVQEYRQRGELLRQETEARKEAERIVRELVDHKGVTPALIERAQFAELARKLAESERHIRSARTETDDVMSKLSEAEIQRDALVSEIVKVASWSDTSYLHALTHVANLVNNLRADCAVAEKGRDQLRAEVERLTKLQHERLPDTLDWHTVMSDVHDYFKNEKADRTRGRGTLLLTLLGGLRNRAETAESHVTTLRDTLKKLKDAAEFLLVAIAARNRRDPSDEARMKDIAGPIVGAVSEARDKANAALSQITVIPETNSSTPNDVLEDTKRLNLLETFGSPTAHGTMLWCVEGAIEKADLRDAIDNLPEAKR